MIKAQYIRFKESVMAPGRAANEVKRAHIHASPTTPRDEVMQEILVDREWVILRQLRKEHDGVERLRERFVHVSMVRDFEPIAALVEPTESDPDSEPKNEPLKRGRNEKAA